MKKFFVIVLALCMSVGIQVKAQSKYSAFLKVSGITTEQAYRAALQNLFNGNSSQWHPQAHAIYVSYLANRFPGKTPQEILDNTQFFVLPAGTQLANVGRISKATGQVSYFPRLSRAGELEGVYQGVRWTLSDCGNSEGIAQAVARIEPYVEREDYGPTPGPSPQTEPQYRRDGAVSQTVTVTPGVPAINITNVMPSQQQQQQSEPRYREPSYGFDPYVQQRNNQPSEVVVKNRPNAWEVIAGVTGIANVGLNIWDLVKDSRNNRYVQNTQTVYRPQPNRGYPQPRPVTRPHPNDWPRNYPTNPGGNNGGGDFQGPGVTSGTGYVNNFAGAYGNNQSSSGVSTVINSTGRTYGNSW